MPLFSHLLKGDVENLSLYPTRERESNSTTTNDKILTTESTENNDNGDNFKHKIYALYIQYIGIPFPRRLFGTIIALVVIIDGAVLFLTLVGAFGYLSSAKQSTILEWSIQIINICFTTLCLLELPFRLKVSTEWLILHWSSDSADVANYNTDHGFGDGKDMNFDQDRTFLNDKRKHHVMHSYRRPANEHTRYLLFGCVNLLKLIQIAFQCWVQYLCLAYIGAQNKRPASAFAVAVGVALPLGCILGAAEAWAEA